MINYVKGKWVKLSNTNINEDSVDATRKVPML